MSASACSIRTAPDGWRQCKACGVAGDADTILICRHTGRLPRANAETVPASDGARESLPAEATHEMLMAAKKLRSFYSLDDYAAIWRGMVQAFTSSHVAPNPLLSHECGKNMVCAICGSLPITSAASTTPQKEPSKLPWDMPVTFDAGRLWLVTANGEWLCQVRGAREQWGQWLADAINAYAASATRQSGIIAELDQLRYDADCPTGSGPDYARYVAALETAHRGGLLAPVSATPRRDAHSLEGEQDTKQLRAFTPAKTAAPGFETEHWNLTMVRMNGDVVLTVRLPSQFSHYVQTPEGRMAAWHPGAVSSVRFTRELWPSFVEQVAEADKVFQACDSLDAIR